MLAFLETHSPKRGTAKFGEEGEQSAMKEIQQPHNGGCIDPIDPFLATEEEKRMVMESFVFVVEKKDGTIESMTVANGGQ